MKKQKFLAGMRRPAIVNITLIIIALSVINSFHAFSQVHPYKFQHLTVDEGLSHTDANDITQDKFGYIWIATYFGLDRFDGYTVKKFYNEETPVHNAFNNRIVCLYPDSYGRVWLGTEGGLQCFDTRKEKYLNISENKGVVTRYFEQLYASSADCLYGLAEGKIRQYRVNGTSITETSLGVPEEVCFYHMVPTANGNIYFATNRGVWVLLPDKKMMQIHLPEINGEHIQNISLGAPDELLVTTSSHIFSLIKSTTAKESFIISKSFPCRQFSPKNVLRSRNGEYWVNTGSGLLRLDRTFKLIQKVDKRSSQYELNADNLSRIFIDRTDCLWVCTFGGGLNFCDLNQKQFYTFQHNADANNTVSGNHIRSILEDEDNLWIGTNANGLNRYNFKTQRFTYFNTSTTGVRLKDNSIASLAIDNLHNLWIGTYKGISILSADRQTLWKPQGYDKFPTYVIETLVKDCYGNMWFGNHTNRFGVIWKDEHRIYHVRYYGEGYFIFADKAKPQLFVSSTHGLKRLIIDQRGNIQQTFQYKATSSPNSLSSDYTYPVYSGDGVNYWIGTIGGGLNRLTLHADGTYQIKAYNKKHGVFNDVESLEMDKAGKVWMGGNGLECLDPLTGNLIRYDKNDGLQGNSFKVGSSYRGASGRLYFGGINGLNYFYPDQIRFNQISAQPRLTQLVINNQSPAYGNADSSANLIREAVGYDNHLTLNYKQNNFVIYFSAMHFANPLKCRYRYKLVGFDQHWQYTDGKKPSAAYNNLDYDRYKFVVEATNNDGIWSKSRAETDITITPPWWKSDLSKIVYAILFICVLSGLYISQARWYGLKREIAVREINERKREEMHLQREELYQQQLMFFTNISHEFRTPLTLIMGPLEDLIRRNMDPAVNYYYELMSRNAKRLVNLISELMNFKKVADSIIKLKVRPLNIIQFCKDLTWDFQNLAASKSITFTMADHTQDFSALPMIAPFDIQVLEKILFNLLNNAFKYTNAGGSVNFEIFFDFENFKPSFHSEFKLLNENHRAKKYIYFRVADSGIGISHESITKIFDRYYRISKNHLGSGIGLALVKSLTQVHKGDIYVYSERHKGTEIIIGIPWGEENYAEAERLALGAEFETQLEAIDNSILAPMSGQQLSDTTGTAKSRKHVLLVDDNEELRTFLKSVLEKIYYIYEAEDGHEALDVAISKVPDLIISDVMMPGMSGIELCKILKEQEETKHIPFIMLSAKDALDTKIEGMESGADFYFAKPLSVELLLLTIQNLFEQNETLKQRYTNNYLAEATEMVHSEKDKEFFQKLLKLIEDNIEDIDVDFLCSHLHVSRTKLYQKIKSVSDQSVGDFIRTVRLKKAVQIMTHEDIAINEVVDRIGFQSSSNFSRAFKKEFGKSPLQFMQSLRKEQKVIK
jgi:signal transduction histidine kinase/DNA-binding response OmpR family regulator/ligand-binding sensor domain-containing protein